MVFPVGHIGELFHKLNWVLFFLCSVEHPAAGYRKIFETVEELNEPIPAKITGNQGWEGYFGNVIGYRLLVTIFKMQYVM